MAYYPEQNLSGQIDEILWQDWDPIGINDCEEARNEYQGYIPHMWGFKLNNADVETIAQFLLKIETDVMELLGDIEKCRKVAEKIIQL